MLKMLVFMNSLLCMTMLELRNKYEVTFGTKPLLGRTQYSLLVELLRNFAQERHVGCEQLRMALKQKMRGLHRTDGVIWALDVQHIMAELRRDATTGCFDIDNQLKGSPINLQDDTEEEWNACMDVLNAMEAKNVAIHPSPSKMTTNPRDDQIVAIIPSGKRYRCNDGWWESDESDKGDSNEQRFCVAKRRCIFDRDGWVRMSDDDDDDSDDDN